MSPALEHIAEQVRAARKQHGWKQDMLAQQAGVSRPLVSKIETAQPTHLLGLLAVFDALGIEMSTTWHHVHEFEMVCRVCGKRAG